MDSWSPATAHVYAATCGVEMLSAVNTSLRQYMRLRGRNSSLGVLLQENGDTINEASWSRHVLRRVPHAYGVLVREGFR